MRRNGNGKQPAANGTGDDHAGLLIDRLAAAIVDDSLPLKEVERELRGCVADVAITKRGLGKRETASRCGVTEKSIENYLKESRTNPKSPEREIARVLQDEMLSLEEIYESVRPVISQAKNFTLDDAKRSLEKLMRTGEVQEYPGHKYRAVDRPSIRYPATVEAHRELVDQKARDLDYIVLTQKEANCEDVERRTQRFSRVVRDTNFVRIDFTVNVSEELLPDFYEKISEEIARITMKYEKKKGPSRVRVLLGMRSVTAILIAALLLLGAGWRVSAQDDAGAERTPEDFAAETRGSWELDRQADEPREKGVDLHGINDGDQSETDVSVRPREGDDRLDRFSELPGVSTTRLVGDVNGDDYVNLTDVVVLMKYLYAQTAELDCPRVADTDANGTLDMSDPIYLLKWLYLGSFSGGTSEPSLLDGKVSEVECDRLAAQ